MVKKISVTFLTIGSLLIVFLTLYFFLEDEIRAEYKKQEAALINVQPLPDERNGETGNNVTVRQYTVHVSNMGGDPEMDLCADGFTEMTTYTTLEPKRLLSQHNRCGGDIVLPMLIGDHVIIENEGEYVITDLKDTPKQSTVDAIKNMNGDVLLQSCYYEGDKMKFVALTVYNK